MNGEHIALLSLAGTLLTTLVVSTWRFSAIQTRMLEANRRLEEKEKQQDERLKLLDAIPEMRTAQAHLEKNHSLIPKLESRVAVLETKAEHSREMRAQWRQSRPDTDE